MSIDIVHLKCDCVDECIDKVHLKRDCADKSNVTEFVKVLFFNFGATSGFNVFTGPIKNLYKKFEKKEKNSILLQE